jgi:hypothetical protein
METKIEIKKNECGLFELHITDEFGEGTTLIKKTKKEIIDFLKETQDGNTMIRDFTPDFN